MIPIRPRALVTGAGGGIGRALTAELHRRGYHVVATDLDRDRLSGVVSDLAVAADLRRVDGLDRLIGQSMPVDLLVNNAGISLWGPVESVPIDEVRRAIEVHLIAGLTLMAAALPSMRERRHGVIVNVSTPMARTPLPCLSAYCASKAALEAASEAVALEVRGFGIRIICFEPGNTLTGIASQRATYGEEGAYRQLFPGPDSPLRRSPSHQPDVMARAIVDAAESDAELYVDRRTLQPELRELQAAHDLPAADGYRQYLEGQVGYAFEEVRTSHDG